MIRSAKRLSSVGSLRAGSLSLAKRAVSSSVMRQPDGLTSLTARCTMRCVVGLSALATRAIFDPLLHFLITREFFVPAGPVSGDAVPRPTRAVSRRPRRPQLIEHALVDFEVTDYALSLSTSALPAQAELHQRDRPASGGSNLRLPAESVEANEGAPITARSNGSNGCGKTDGRVCAFVRSITITRSSLRSFHAS